MTAPKKTAEQEFDDAPNAEAEFDAAPEASATTAHENEKRTKPLNATLGENIAALIRRQRDQLPNKLRSAAMGLYNNAASRPEEFYKTVAEPDGQNPGWNTEHPEVHAKYMKDVREQPGSNIAGSMLQPNPLGKVSAATKLGKVGLAAGRIAYAGANGEMARYLGEEPGAKDSGGLSGALGPMAVQTGVEVASPLLKGAGNTLKGFARGRSLATLSPSKADIAKLQTLGIADDVADDLYKSSAFRPWSTTEGVSERLSGPGGIVDQRGEKLGGIIKGLDDASGGATTQPSAAVDRIRSMSDDQFGKSTAFRGKAVVANREADAIAKQYGNQSMSLADSENYLKRGYDDEAVKRINAEAKGAAPSPKTDAMALVREAIKKQNEDAAEATASAVAPHLKGQFVPAKQGFGRMAEAERIADKTGGPKAANRYLSPSDYGFGIASGQAYGGSPITDMINKPVAESLWGLAGSIAHKQLRTRGSALAAHMAYPGAAVTGFAGRQINRSPAASSALANYLQAKPDEEREETGSAAFTSETGGR